MGLQKLWWGCAEWFHSSRWKSIHSHLIHLTFSSLKFCCFLLRKMNKRYPRFCMSHSLIWFEKYFSLNRIWFSWLDDFNTGIVFLTLYMVSLSPSYLSFILFMSVLYSVISLAQMFMNLKCDRFARMGKPLKQRQPMVLLPAIFEFIRRAVKPVQTVLLQFLPGHKVLRIGKTWNWNSYNCFFFIL